MAVIDENKIYEEINRVKNVNTDNRKKVDELISKLNLIANKSSELTSNSAFIKGDFGTKYSSYNDNISIDIKTLSSYLNTNTLQAMKDVDLYIENLNTIDRMLKEKTSLSLENARETLELKKKKLEEFLKDGNITFDEAIEASNFYIDDSTVNPELKTLAEDIKIHKTKLEQLEKSAASIVGLGGTDYNNILAEKSTIQAELENLLLKYKDLLQVEFDKYQSDLNNVMVENPKIKQIETQIEELLNENLKLLIEIETLSKDDIKPSAKKDVITIPVDSGVIDSYTLDQNYITNIPSLNGIVVQSYDKDCVRQYKENNGYLIELPYKVYIKRVEVLRAYVKAKDSLLGQAVGLKVADDYVNYIQKKNVLELDQESTDVTKLGKYVNESFIGEYANKYTSLLNASVNAQVQSINDIYLEEKDKLAREYAERYAEVSASNGDLVALKRFYEGKSTSLDEMKGYLEENVIKLKNSTSTEVSELYGKYDALINKVGMEETKPILVKDIDALYANQMSAITSREDAFINKKDFTSYESRVELRTLVTVDPTFKEKLKELYPDIDIKY